MVLNDVLHRVPFRSEDVAEGLGAKAVDYNGVLVFVYYLPQPGLNPLVLGPRDLSLEDAVLNPVEVPAKELLDVVDAPDVDVVDNDDVHNTTIGVRKFWI